MQGLSQTLTLSSVETGVPANPGGASSHERGSSTDERGRTIRHGELRDGQWARRGRAELDTVCKTTRGPSPERVMSRRVATPRRAIVAPVHLPYICCPVGMKIQNPNGKIGPLGFSSQNSARTRSACRRKRGGRRAALVGARAAHSPWRPPGRQLRPPRRHTGSGRRSWHSISTGSTILPRSPRKASSTPLGLSGTGSSGRTEIFATRSNSTSRSSVLPSVSALLRHRLHPAARRHPRCAE